MRAGSFGLSLLGVPLHVQILTALQSGPESLTDRRAATGSPPQTTLRARLKTLASLGIVERLGTAQGGRGLEFGLSAPGHALLGVGRALERWLAIRPNGRLELRDTAARSAVKALVDGWSSAIVRALAARPLSLTELDQLIPGLNYPTIERRLVAMRLVGLIEPCPSVGRSTPYVVTGWLRRGLAPLVAATGWEREHLDQTAAPPIRRFDVEAAFLLAVPPLALDPAVGGICRLSVGLGSRSDNARPAGVRVAVDSGEIISCLADLNAPVDAWVDGSAAAWIRAVTDGDPERLDAGGNLPLAGELLDQLHAALLGRNRARPTSVTKCLLRHRSV